MLVSDPHEPEKIWIAVSPMQSSARMEVRSVFSLPTIARFTRGVQVCQEAVLRN